MRGRPGSINTPLLINSVDFPSWKILALFLIMLFFSNCVQSLHSRYDVTERDTKLQDFKVATLILFVVSAVTSE